MASAWIERTFAKRACVRFVPDAASRERCACGEYRLYHHDATAASGNTSTLTWNELRDTRTYRTDAYGSIDFEGGCGTDVVKFLRLDYLSTPKDIVQLLVHKWGFEAPRLVVSIHGCATDQGFSVIDEFRLHPRLKKPLRKGLRKIISAPGCWIITDGSNASVLHLIKEATIKKQTSHTRVGNVIGVNHWGTFGDKHHLTGRGIFVKCQRPHAFPAESMSFSCGRKCLLLADDGRATETGCETALRRKLEFYLAERVGETGVALGASVVCLLIGGRARDIHPIVEYVTAMPPVPVVICEGTGGCADLLALACRLTENTGEVNEVQKEIILAEIRKLVRSQSDAAADLDAQVVEDVFSSLCRCLRNRSLISSFTLSMTPTDGMEKNLDSVVLGALLHGCQGSSFQEQLSLTISWSRPDLAKQHIFRSDRWMSVNALHDSMKHALIYDKADFVNLLLNNGVNMKRFLTQECLEELYNAVPLHAGSRNTLDFLLKTERGSPQRRVTLKDIGQVINRLMGVGFKSAYKRLGSDGAVKKRRWTTTFGTKEKSDSSPIDNSTQVYFEFPHNELLIWAILTDRKKLPKLMWRREQEVLAKAVVACKLYTALAMELESSSQIDRLIMEDYQRQARKFEERAIETLDLCFRYNSELSKHLLCCRLSNWSNQNVLSLAHSAGMKDFMVHACCQSVITHIWLGGLTVNKQASVKVLCGILLPPTINAVCFHHQANRIASNSETRAFVNEAFDASDINDSQKCDEMWSRLPEKNWTTHADEMDNKNDGTNAASHRGRLHMLYAFYRAPITKFWMHTIAFCTFLAALSYTVVTRMERTPRWSEIFCYFYVFFLSLEIVREVSNYTYLSFSKRLSTFFSDKWNVLDTVASLLFLTGVILRFRDDELLLLTGKYLYCIAIATWYIRLLENLAVNRTIGYFTAVIRSMTPIIYKFGVLATIFLVGFGIPKQGIRFPKRDASWELLKNVTMMPYFVLYGELYKKEIDGFCTDDGNIDSCLPGYWLHPLLEGIYLMIGTNAIVNTFFTWINIDYQKICLDCDKLWMFQRYALAIGYRDTLVLPPPLTFLGYIYLVIAKFLNLKGDSSASSGNYGSCLSDKQLSYLRSFEEQCVTNGLLEKDKRVQATLKKKIRKAHKRMCKLDAMLTRRQKVLGMAKTSPALNAVLSQDVKDIETSIEHMLAAAQVMDKRMAVMETLAEQRLALVSQLADMVKNRSTPQSLDPDYSSQAFSCLSKFLVAEQPTSAGADEATATILCASQAAVASSTADQDVVSAVVGVDRTADGTPAAAAAAHNDEIKDSSRISLDTLVVYSSARRVFSELPDSETAELDDDMPKLRADVSSEGFDGLDRTRMSSDNLSGECRLELYSDCQHLSMAFTSTTDDSIHMHTHGMVVNAGGPQSGESCQGAFGEARIACQSCSSTAERIAYGEDGNELLTTSDDDVVLRGIEENAAVIIGERLQDKMLAISCNVATGAFSEECTLFAECDCSSLEDAPKPPAADRQLYNVAVVTTLTEAIAGDAEDKEIFRFQRNEAPEKVNIEPAPLGFTTDEQLASKPCSAMDQQHSCEGSSLRVIHRSGYRRAPRPFLSLPIVAKEQRRSGSEPCAHNDDEHLLRSLSQQSISSTALSELSAHTETSLLSE